MKRLLILCLSPDCDSVLWSTEWDDGSPEFTKIEGIGALDDNMFCKKCQGKASPPQLSVINNSEDFEKMMARRKTANKKKNGGRR